MANCLTNFSATNLVFLDFDTNMLTFAYDSSTRTLRRTKNGVSRSLLSGCDSAEFSIFQRTPSGGNGEFCSTTNAAECKLVEMTWTCSRTNDTGGADPGSGQSDSARCNPELDDIQFSAIGVGTVPSMPWVNRPTFQQVVQYPAQRTP